MWVVMATVTPPPTAIVARSGDEALQGHPCGGVPLDGNPWCRSADCYEKIEQIGEGTFGQVFKARDRETGRVVALKKVLMVKEREGFPITAIREIKLLKALRHPNIVNLIEVVMSQASEGNKWRGSVYMVFEYVDHDLKGLQTRLSEAGRKFRPEHVKCLMLQLLEAVNHMHRHNVLHRDIKGSNLLLSDAGDLKVADFGLSRFFLGKNQALTPNVITLWYRPPELLLGMDEYGTAADMWSLGCIFGELLYGREILAARRVDDMEQLELIYALCGTPNEDNWPGVTKLKHWNTFRPAVQKPVAIRERFRSDPNFTPAAINLLENLLQLDPSKRLTAKDALIHDYFYRELPAACLSRDLPKYEASHEWTTKKRRQAARAAAGVPTQEPPAAHDQAGAAAKRPRADM